MTERHGSSYTGSASDPPCAARCPLGEYKKVSAGESGELSYVLGATLTKAEVAHSVRFLRQFGEQVCQGIKRQHSQGRLERGHQVDYR